MSAWRRLTQDRHMDSCCFFSRPRWNIFHSCALSHTILPLFVFVCMCVCAFSDFACDGSESSQWKWPSSCIFLSLFLPVCLSVCSCLLILYNRACDGTWAQPMEMTGWGYCLCRVPFFFRNSVFSCSCRSLTCTQKLLSRDEYWPSEKFKWGSLHFSVFLWKRRSVKITAGACGT